MKILITGGVGFIGSHLVDLMLNKGYQVACVDNLHLGRMENINHQLSNPSFSFHEFDILDFDKLNVLFKENNFDIVYHLVANSDIKQSFNDTKLDLNMNFITTYNVLEVMRLNDVKQIVFASTSAILACLRPSRYPDRWV